MPCFLPLLLELIVICNVAGSPGQNKLGMITATVAGRKDVSEYASDLVCLEVLAIMGHSIDSGLGHLLAWCEFD